MIACTHIWIRQIHSPHLLEKKRVFEEAPACWHRAISTVNTGREERHPEHNHTVRGFPAAMFTSRVICLRNSCIDLFLTTILQMCLRKTVTGSGDNPVFGTKNAPIMDHFTLYGKVKKQMKTIRNTLKNMSKTCKSCCHYKSQMKLQYRFVVWWREANWKSEGLPKSMDIPEELQKCCMCRGGVQLFRVYWQSLCHFKTDTVARTSLTPCDRG